MRSLFSILVVLTFILLGSFNDPVRIIFYGDSITAGYGLDPEQAFPRLVETILKSEGHNVQVINAGLSGETSAGGSSRINWILRSPVDIFILELGANDGLRGINLDDTKKNLQDIIDKVREKNPEVKIIIAGMMVPPNLGEDYTTQFRDLYPSLAKENNATLIPFLLEGVAGNKDLNLPDGIHPNPQGHQIVSETVSHVIRKVIQ